VRRRQVRRQTWWQLIALAIAVALAVIVLCAPREVRRRRVEAAIARFQASPSKSMTNELRLLLANGVPTNGQGGRILHLISRPTLLARSTYPVNRVPSVSIEWPFRFESWALNDTRLSITVPKAYVQLEGQEKPTDDSINTGILSYQPMLLRCGTQPLPVGTHHGQVCIDWSLIHSESEASVWMRLKSLLRARRLIRGMDRKVRFYDAHFEIPVEITVAEAAAAEQVALVSDPRLDEAVRQSFTHLYRDRYPLERTPRRLAYKGMFCLMWKNAPIALAFEPVLRLPDGREVLNEFRRTVGLGRFRTRAGDSGLLYCTHFIRQFLVAEPGEYEATIVLKPDPNLAYEDPAIKAIWGGTLEFPISFSVYEEPQSR